MTFADFARGHGLKTCRSCCVEKPLSEFGKHAVTKDGLRRVCKECNNRAASEWGKNNRDKARARNAAYRKKEPERNRGYGEKWRAANREKVAQTKAKWYREHKDRWRSYKATRRARRRNAAGVFSASQIDELLRLQRGRCALCASRLGKLFHRDHIVPLSKGGSNEISNIQLCCAPCNTRKHATDPIEYARRLGRLL